MHPLKELAVRVHAANEKWWCNPISGARIERNFGELMMLAVSELSEALEGDRKDLMDDKLPHRRMAEVEIADCIIRLLDTAEGLGMDLAGAFEEKMEFNAKRHDHTFAGRLEAGGKKY
jgi:NTP pyrophosphatase (non-canonical NTP hydrolase)